MPGFRFRRSSVILCLAPAMALSFTAGPNTAAHWIFEPGHVQGNIFRNQASGDNASRFNLPWQQTPAFDTLEGQVGVQVLPTAFGRLPYHLDLTAGNARGILSYGARIKLDTIRKDYSSFIAGFYETQRFMVDTVGRIHLGVQNVGGRRAPQQWLRTDSEKDQPRVQVGRWHEVVFTIDARNPHRVLNYLFLDGKQLKSPHFAVHDDGIRSTGLSYFQVGKDPGNSGPPWYNGPFHGLMGEVIVEKGYLIQPQRPHTDPILNRVNLGIQSVGVQPGEEVWASVFLTNYSPLTVTLCQFTLGLDPSVAELLEVRAEGVGRNWTVQWSSSGAGRYNISSSGPSSPMGYGQGEILRLRLRARADAQAGDSSAMPLDMPRIDANRMLEISTTTGIFRVRQPVILYGDVTGDGKVDAEDARMIFLYVAGKLTLPDPSAPNFTLEVADVSGDGRITGYDGALVLQYAAGIISDFPVSRRAALAKSASSTGDAVLSLSAPVSLGNGIFEYRLGGENLEDFLAGEFVLERDSSVAVSIDSVYSGLQLGGLSFHGAQGEDRFVVVAATNDRFQDFSVPLFSVRVRQNSAGNALTLKSAYLNEGRITGNFLSQPAVSGSSRIGLRSPGLKAHKLRLSGNWLEIPDPGHGQVTVALFHLSGREVFRGEYRAQGKALRIPLGKSERGVFLYEIRLRGISERGYLASM